MIHFEKGKDDERYSFHLIDKKAGIEMGIYPVAFGYRVRAGRTDGQPEVDYCGGSDANFVSILYSLVKKALENGTKVDKFPPQHSKPFYMDPENLGKLADLAKGWSRSHNIHQSSLEKTRSSKFEKI